jgi:hypothetical protein
MKRVVVVNVRNYKIYADGNGAKKARIGHQNFIYKIGLEKNPKFCRGAARRTGGKPKFFRGGAARQAG